MWSFSPFCQLLRQVHLTDVSSASMYYMGEKTHIFASRRFSSRMKAKGKTHVCFPKRSPKRLRTALQAVPSVPRLTLAMAAVVALFAALFVDHRVAAALGTQVPGDAHMAHAQQAGGFFVMTVAVILAIA